MCKNFLSLDISLEIGFFICENSKLGVTTVQEIWVNESTTVNAHSNTQIAKSVAMPASDYYLMEVSVKLLPVSENADGTTTYIYLSVRDGSKLLSVDRSFPLDYHNVQKSLFFMYWLPSGTKLELWVQTDKKRDSSGYLIRIFRLFTA